jgi:hypothetical protein
MYNKYLKILLNKMHRDELVELELFIHNLENHIKQTRNKIEPISDMWYYGTKRHLIEYEITCMILTLIHLKNVYNINK